MKEEIAKILKEFGVDNLTAKTVRVKLEEVMGLEPGELKPKKDEISKIIDALIEEQEQADGGAEEEEEEEKPPPKKKAKAAKTEDEAGPSEGGEKKAKMTCQTKSGEECPKQIKDLQSKMKMSKKEFLANAETLELDLAGNRLTGEPRDFSSGNLGWYLNGKVEMAVGKKTVWAQVGINITIPGSASWK